MNNDKIDLSKSYCFENKSSRSPGLKFKKEDFILPDAFPWRNTVVLYDIDTLNDLKTIFELTRTILERADNVSALINIKASLDTQIEKIKNTFINVKSLMIAHENFFYMIMKI